MCSVVLANLIGNLLTSKTRARSFFQQVPWHRKTRNLWVYAAMAASVAVCLGAVYLPEFQSRFHMRPVPPAFYGAAVVAGLLIFALDEFRKLFVTHKWLGMDKVAW